MSIRLIACLILMAFHAHAVTIEQPLDDPRLEQRARAVFSELKCVVCEGQALAESDAPLARDMRGHIRTMIADGKSDTEIFAFFVTRYGKQVLLNPPLETATILLWTAPLLLLLIGVLLLKRIVRHP